jgi:predicted LPLAT superfamily acyltransferase
MSAGTGPAAAEWTRRPERGSPALVRFMARLSIAVGRPFSRLLMHVIAVYFYVFSPRARRESIAYLRRCLGREPSLAERFRVFHSFASTIHDRLFFICDRYDMFDVQVHGGDLFAPGGNLLMGAHVGSFEAMRATGHHHGHRRVAMAMYEENARRLNAILDAIHAGAHDDVVPLGHLDSMLALKARLDRGDLVGVLADRTLGAEPVVRIPFLGEPAPFPTGPMRMAAALRQPVFFMVGLYRGGNRYEVRFEKIADFTAQERAGRDAAIQAAIEAYAARLEHYVRAAPDNWFNFHDFWVKP